MAIIYGVPASPFVRKTMLAHAYKNVPYEFKVTMPGSDEPQFRKISPLGKVPGYQTDDGSGFSDSSVIVAYLERTATDIKLYPESNNDFAHALWLEEYGDTKMMEATAALYFQRILGPKFFNQQTDPDRVNQLVTELIPAVLDYVETEMESQWFVGDAISIADITIGTNLINLYHANFEIDPARWPKLAEFNRRFMAQDFVQTQIATEQQMFAQAS